MIGLGDPGRCVRDGAAAPRCSPTQAGLRAINTTQNPAFASPSEFGPLGTDKFGRDVINPVHLGRRGSASSSAWQRRCMAIVIGSVVGITGGLLRQALSAAS